MNYGNTLIWGENLSDPVVPEGERYATGRRCYNCGHVRSEHVRLGILWWKHDECLGCDCKHFVPVTDDQEDF